VSAQAYVEGALAGTGYPIVTGRWPEQITQPTLVIRTTAGQPAGTGRARAWEVTVTVLSPLTVTDPDTDLDASVGKVLDALDATQPLTWLRAERAAVAGDAYAAMDVTVAVTLTAAPTP
jgi:hypothetical protein